MRGIPPQGTGEGNRERGARLGAVGWRNELTSQVGTGGRGLWEMGFSQFPWGKREAPYF